MGHYRPTVCLSLLPGFRKYCPIYYNLRSAHNFKEAVLNRINLNPHCGCVDNALITKIVDDIIDEIDLKPLNVVSYDDTAKWLESRPYTRQRKDQLLRAMESLPRDDFARFILSGNVSCFIKYENYPGVKPPRLIATRSDVDKCLLGPYFHYIDDHLFNSIYSVKHIPYDDRPRVIEERFSKYLSQGWKVFCGDYTAFECSANRFAQLNFEYQLYQKIFPSHVVESMKEVLLSPRTKLSGYSLGHAFTTPVRFSGEMNTSCGNTLYNLISLKYASSRCGFASEPIVEGDDSMICIPPDLDVDLFVSYLEQCGLCVKYDIYDSPGVAGYCSSYWNDSTATPTADLKDALINLSYCVKSMVDQFGIRAMLSSKITSYLIQYPHNPFFIELAKSLGIQSRVIERFNAYMFDEYRRSGVELHEEKGFMIGDVPINPSYTLRDVTSALEFNNLTMNDFDTFKHYLAQGRYSYAVDNLLTALLPNSGPFLYDDYRCYRPARNVPSQ